MDHHPPKHLIEEILSRRNFAVAGASRDQSKFGYQVYHFLKRAGYAVFPVNPNADYIDGDEVYPLLDNVPVKLDCVVTLTQPEITFEIVKQAGRLRIPYVWMQPGSESVAAVNEAIAVGCQVVSGGPCIMVEIGRLQAQHENRA
jgi:predicted CoA-binding protein